MPGLFSGEVAWAWASRDRVTVSQMPRPREVTPAFKGCTAAAADAGQPVHGPRLLWTDSVTVARPSGPCACPRLDLESVLSERPPRLPVSA